MSTQTVEQNESKPTAGGARKLIREVKYHTRKRFSAEEMIRIVLEGFRKELPTSELCRRENVSTALYYSWLKDFMEAGKDRLTKDYTRDATKSETKDLRNENVRLKELLGEQALEIQVFKKSLKR
jgi:transposase